MRTRIFTLTSLAMVAFAANSLLCRLALRRMAIDAATFSSIRIVSGAVALWLILTVRRSPTLDSGNWFSAAALFAYVAAFSFAYNTLSAGTGALLLFAAVQSTMIAWGLWRGEQLHIQQWIGVTVAFGGLVLLLLPGLSAPALSGSALMVGAGVAWGIYSVRGKQSRDSVGSTAGNFIRAVPMTALLSVSFLQFAHADAVGIAYAVLSGALTSGLGYVIWYAALTGLTATVAAIVQLSAPVLAAIGGILFLSEPLTARFAVASLVVLGGIALVVIRKI